MTDDPSELEPAVAATAGRGGVLGLLRHVAIDLSPLRTSREFRLLWSGQAVSFLGSFVTYVAVQYQMYQLTHSSLAVGMLALCELVPLLTMSFVGGALADAVDRRKLFLRAETALTCVPLLLLLNALLPHPRVWPLYVLAGAAAGLDGLGRPSLWALLPQLVEKDQLASATALHSLYVNLGAVAGPALGGLLIATLGLRGAYGADVASFAISLATLRAMRATPPPDDAERPSLRSVVEGFRYARSNPVLMGTYLVDFNAMIFGMPSALFPELAAKRFASSGLAPATVLGLLHGATYAGALLGTMTSGWVRHVRRHGAAILWSVVAWGVAITAFGFATSLWLALPLIAVAGAGDFVSATFRSTIWNQTIPDHLRGRLAGIELANVASGPLLGNAEAGAMARLTSARFSIVSGGLACLAGTALIALLLPGFARYRSDRGGET
ncbi:MAG TPA: MFS transporter [Mycobacteriales bacterium]|jgi:MFS family permease|nr:MFS transporter [Mycobacteriales bacterium]